MPGRRGRLLAGAALLAGLVVGGGLAACGGPAASGGPGGPATPAGTPSPTPFSCPSGLVPVRIWPDGRDGTRVRVLDASGRDALGASVANDLRQPARGFQVVEVREITEPLDAVAVLRAGPLAYGDAHFMRPLFDGDVRVEFDVARADEVVDVVIGERFRALATVTEVNRRTARLEKPTAPPGTCAMPLG